MTLVSATRLDLVTPTKPASPSVALVNDYDELDGSSPLLPAVDLGLWLGLILGLIILAALGLLVI